MSTATRPAPAAIIPLGDLRIEHAGSRVRVVGFITAVNTELNHAIIQHGKAALVVDYSLCLSDEAIDDRQSRARPPRKSAPTHEQSRSPLYSAQYRTALPAHKSKMMVIGELVSCTGTEIHPMPGVLAGITLQATLMKECIDLDLEVWERAARVESQVRWEEATKRTSSSNQTL